MREVKGFSYRVEPTEVGFAVLRNDQPMTSPSGAPVVVPTHGLGLAICDEMALWNSKKLKAWGPLTQLSLTAIDITGTKQAYEVERLAQCARHDVLCHRADQPLELADRQRCLWDPLLAWCRTRFNAPLECTDNIMALAQPSASLQAFANFIQALDLFRLTGLSEAVSLTGSLVLGLALLTRHLTAESVFEAAELEASFQMERWGEDSLATERRASIRADLNTCERYFALLG